MTDRTLVLNVPIPPDALWPNVRSHYMEKARATKRQRGRAHLIGLDQVNRGRWGRPARVASIQATFWLSRARDPDNCIAALKSTIDGLVDAGVLATDRHLTILPVELRLKSAGWRNAPTPCPGVVLTITAPMKE